MKNNKIVWFEGMTLDPHHFQQWDRYHAASLNTRIRSVSPYDWGLFECEIDRDSLANGNLKINRCSGIMPDGLPFDMPYTDPVPAFRNIEDQFSPTQSHLPVFLAVPSERPGGLNCLLSASVYDKVTRYRMEEMAVNDENSGADERTVGVARTHYQLLVGTDTTEDYTFIKIAEVTRNPEGVCILSGEYIPPCLLISASGNLIRLIRTVVELLVARGNALMRNRRQAPTGQFEIGPSDIPVYMNLRSINTWIPLLNQYLTLPRVHPYQVYSSLLTLAGQLSTFSPGDTLLSADLPAYNHAEPAPAFYILEKHIRKLLGEAVPAKNYAVIELERKGQTLYLGNIDDTGLLQDAEFYVICKGDIPESKISADIPVKIRVASKEMIHEILSTATRALPVTYSPKPPNGVPGRPGFHYYKLEKKGVFWKAIQQSRNIALYIPAEFVGVTIELIAVKESGSK
jgi:type VI secretion system protein ImpJ